MKPEAEVRKCRLYLLTLSTKSGTVSISLLTISIFICTVSRMDL